MKVGVYRDGCWQWISSWRAYPMLRKIQTGFIVGPVLTIQEK